ncbi:Calponin-homology (CH) domain-containing protein [Balamuthia mandrillaris]
MAFLAPRTYSAPVTTGSSSSKYSDEPAVDETYVGSAPAVVNATSEIVMKNGYQLYGMDAELELKRRGKFDPEYEANALKWIAQVSGEKVTDVWEGLHSGVILCRVVNEVFPGAITKVDTRDIPLVHRENIAKYLDFCRSYQMEATDLFNISDLYEKKDLFQVVQNVYALARIVERKMKFGGPSLRLKAALSSSKSMLALPRPKMVALRDGDDTSTYSSAQDKADSSISAKTAIPVQSSSDKTTPNSTAAFSKKLREKFFEPGEQGNKNAKQAASPTATAGQSSFFGTFKRMIWPFSTAVANKPTSTPGASFQTKRATFSEPLASMARRAADEKQCSPLLIHGVVFLLVSLCLGSVGSAASLQQLRTDCLLTGTTLLLLSCLILPSLSAALGSSISSVQRSITLASYCNALASFIGLFGTAFSATAEPTVESLWGFGLISMLLFCVSAVCGGFAFIRIYQAYSRS